WARLGLAYDQGISESPPFVKRDGTEFKIAGSYAPGRQTVIVDLDANKEYAIAAFPSLEEKGRRLFWDVMASLCIERSRQPAGSRSHLQRFVLLVSPFQ